MKLSLIGQVVLEEMKFEKVEGQTTEGQTPE